MTLVGPRCREALISRSGSAATPAASWSRNITALVLSEVGALQQQRPTKFMGRVGKVLTTDDTENMDDTNHQDTESLRLRNNGHVKILQRCAHNLDGETLLRQTASVRS